MAEHSLLIADIGGTNARFAIAQPDAHGYDRELVLKCADYETPEAAIRHYLKETDSEDPGVICLAVAGPVNQGSVTFTNSHWKIAEAHLAESFNLAAARLLNDFTAVALSIPAIESPDLLRLGPDSPMPTERGLEHYCVGVIGPGTGLGAAGLIRHGQVQLPVTTESGHAGFAPMNSRQAEINRILGARFGRISNERLVSGPGLENLCAALAEIDGVEPFDGSAGVIFEAAMCGDNPLATESVELFFEILGQVAGDFALNIGAFDGIYLAGGVIQRYGDQLQQSRFRTAFEDKGRLSRRLTQTPTALITHAQPGLLGASEMARSIARALPAV